jgi:hypothetical protein
MSHSKYFSASKSAQWIACPGSIALEQGLSDSSSVYADEGTAAHFLASECLENNLDVADYEGREIVIVNGYARWAYSSDEPGDDPRFAVSDLTEVQTYLDNVRGLAGENLILVEQRVEYSHVTGQPESFGTADCIILLEPELQVHDLKFGKGVKVDAEHNTQMMLYALGALAQCEMLGEFTAVRMFIHQPRLGHISEWGITVDMLKQWGKMEAGRAADRVMAAIDYHKAQGEVHEKYLNPGEKQCRWCKAKATCPALRNEIADTVGNKQPGTNDEFDVVSEEVIAKAPSEHLSIVMSKVDLIEDWCRAVRAEVERRLANGVPVPGYKLVEGRRGSRAWSNKDEAETMLKGFRLKAEQMYEFKLITPTAAEKLAKSEVIGKRQWPKLQALITQADGKPSVAPESDPRPAITLQATADEFDTVEAGCDLV